MYIYKTTNLITGHVYIGQCARPESSTKNYFGSGKSYKIAEKKFGKKNFINEIIDRAETLDDLNVKEIYWISFYESENPLKGYNLTPGGTTCDLSEQIKLSLDNNIERKRKSKLSKDLWDNPEYREQVTNENIKTWSTNEKRKEHSDRMKQVYAEGDGKENLRLSAKKMLIVSCPHCEKCGKLNAMNNSHFDNCTNPNNPLYLQACKRRHKININTKKIKCPHCSKTGSVGNMNRWHLDNCKNINNEKS